MYNLGVALRRSGRPAEALLQFQHALSLKPGFEPAMTQLQQMQEELRHGLPVQGR